MRKYRLVAKKGEGTFSEVLKAQNVKDGKYHAIKCMKNRFESIDQVNNLREIQALRRLSPHEHIITLEEVLYDQPTGRLALVFELMDANLYELIRGRRHHLNPNLIKSYMWQLMKSLDHMHKKGIFHRDIKPENILIESSNDTSKGLKLADFGSCRGIYSKQPYTEYISTRWYRAPECLLTDGYYGPEMDLWGAGCVMFEITSLYPLFPGANEVDQINRIHKVFGTPNAEILAKFRSKGASHISFDFPAQKGIGLGQLIPHALPDCVDLLIKLLKYDASDRITAREAIRHPYFKDVREAEQKEQAKAAAAAAAAPPVESAPQVVAPSASVTNKNLPTISNHSDSKKNSHGSNAYQQNHSSQEYQQQLLKQQQQQQQQQAQQSYGTHSGKAHGGNAHGGAGAGAGAGSLPPINSFSGGAGASVMGANNAYLSNPNNMHVASKHQSHGQGNTAARTMGSIQNPNSNNASGTQKKRKKYKSHSNQYVSDNVMKAYGVPKIITGSTAASQAGMGQSGGGGGANGAGGMSVGGNSFNAGNSNGGGTFNHPNRHYVRKG